MLQTPKVSCLKCGKEFQITQIRSHCELCGVTVSGDSEVANSNRPQLTIEKVQCYSCYKLVSSLVYTIAHQGQMPNGKIMV